MRILLDNTSYKFDNHGDTAMLVIAHSRLKELWPEAIFEVTTAQPDRLEEHCAGALPVDVRYPAIWTRISGLMRSKAPPWLTGWRPRVEGVLKLRVRSTANQARSQALMRADLVVHSGAGVITDTFIGDALLRLDLLRQAIAANKPTAMFSQGIGPLSDAKLISLAARVLPSVDFISLREGLGSLASLRSLGVDPARTAITGDDAIALAYPLRPQILGHDLGVNIRLAHYAGLLASDGSILSALRASLAGVAESRGARLASIPIASDDANSVALMLTGSESPAGNAERKTPLSTRLLDFHRCRVVVTGSYHAAVFALSQGISAIGLAKSEYYAQKFQGLIAQFGDGCQMLDLNGARIREDLTAMIDRAWAQADQVRPGLLRAARQQFVAGTAAYDEFFRIATRRLRNLA